VPRKLDIATRRTDVRSVNDVILVDAHHRLDDDLDAAYRRKYGRYRGPTDRIVAAAARERPRCASIAPDRPSLPPSSRSIIMELCAAPATVKTPAENFTGDVYLDPVFNGDGTSQLVVGLVRFTPGARTNWHSHPNGQLLRCTDGVGLVVTRDGTAIRMRAGDAVWTPAGQEHWHGGTSNSMMCHYAILDAAGDGGAATWLEPVTDDQYTAAHAAV
jgi:quercetin dioxygenase-like cupin family protein